MKKTVASLTFLLLITLAISACNIPSASVSTPSLSVQEQAATAAAMTVEALTTQMAVPTNTPEPTATQAPTNTPQNILPTNTVPVVVFPTNTAVVVATAVPCDKAAFVSDVNVPDGSDYKPGETFTKTWRLKNAGSCTWSTGYKLVFKSGNAMEGPASVTMPTSVAPGATIDVSVNLKAPATGGTYTGNYKLQNANGVDFGVGVSGQESFWVKIDVVTGSGTAAPTTGAGTPTVTPKPEQFAITKISLVVTPASATGCPTEFTVTADITVNRAGTIQYHWILDGADFSATTPLEYTSAGTKQVSLKLSLSETKVHTITLRNDFPNHASWNANFSLTCP
jgi:hypothetical protein